MSYNLNIDLKKRTDRSGKNFYVGKIKVPGLLNLEKGASFLVFISEDGCEQLQIAPFKDTKDSDDYDYED